MPTVTQVNDLKINKLTKAQYDEAVQSGVIGENEISIITDLDAGQIIQVDTLPTASATEEGKIYQYIGVTDANYTNGYFYKCVSDGQSPATYSWENIEVQPAPVIPDPLPSQSGNAGKFLTTDGTDVSWSDKPLINGKDSSATDSILIDTTDSTYMPNNAIAIGSGSLVKSNGGIAIGAHDDTTSHLSATANGGIAIGSGSLSVSYGVSIGKQAKALAYNGGNCVAIGYRAKAMDGCIVIGSDAQTSGNIFNGIQLGTGINDESGTFKVGLASGNWPGTWNNYKLLDSDGTIPEARLADTTSATSGQVLQLDSNNNAVWKNIISTPSTIPTLLSNSWTEDPTTHEITQTVSVVGVTLTNLVMVGPTPVSAEDYNDSDVICIAQGVDTLTFKCATIPSVDLTLNVLCF